MDDPVFALIDEHRAATLAYDEHTADEDAEFRMADIAFAIATTPPTTLAGTIAVLAYADG